MQVDEGAPEASPAPEENGNALDDPTAADVDDAQQAKGLDENGLAEDEAAAMNEQLMGMD